ncbi:MAG: ribosome small subunit-dependent GTPase A [Ignavibacteriaceae bacterium]|nr:ribosome small subunit-dependent GTPase A [Ignavibacteriaceae bacterium]
MVCRIESKDYYVFPENEEGIIRCSLPGKFKNDFKLKKDKQYLMDIVVVGDFVDYELNRDGSGVINKIEARRNYLSRKAPKIKGSSYRGERLEQIIASNMDNLFIVSSVAEPPFNYKSLDRLLVAGESSGTDISIIFNKTDLDDGTFIEFWSELYKKIGYNVFLTSVVNNEGIDEVKKHLQGKKNVFFGQSGVGKSSLLNTMFSELTLKTGAISSFTDRGTHTTVTGVMIKVDPETYIIDTPGIREIAPYGITKEDLSHYFIEFSEIQKNCKFNTCTHSHEPGCAVTEAVQDGYISEERYDSYLRILETIEEDVPL